MTAGAGVVHSEMPEAEFARTGGRMHGFQLWVNLPRRDKMMRPRYQEIASGHIPTAASADGAVTVNVIAGEALGVRAVIDTRTPITFLHFTLQPGARLVQPIPRDYQAFAYVAGGAGRFGFDARPARARQMVAFANDGGGVALVTPVDAEEPLSVLLIAGRPLHEPVVRYGPFVMNTEAEIRQAFLDYQRGRMGAIAV
jgi:quercetin 2,3-dioxygenase